MFKTFSFILIFISFLISFSSLAEEQKPAVIDEELQLSEEAFLDLERRSEEGDMRAMAKLGIAYMVGNGVESDVEYAKVLLKVSAESGDIIGLNNLATYYNLMGTEEEKLLINPLFKKAADLGEKVAALNLGQNYYLGAYSLEPDYKQAKKYLKIAVKDDVLASQANYYLGLMAYFGRGVKENKKKAIKLIQAAADAGNWNAQFDMAGFYEVGDGVQKDAAKAHEWYVKAALNDHAKAAWIVGMAYVYGEVVEKDPEMAIKWFRVSADLGNAQGYASLGVMYATGDGIEQNFEMAFNNYVEAVKRGEGHAARIIGQMYQYGQYVEVDQYMAAIWFEIAVYLKGDDALDFVYQYRDANTDEVIAEVKAGARKWLDANDVDYDLE